MKDTVEITVKLEPNGEVSIRYTDPFDPNSEEFTISHTEDLPSLRTAMARAADVIERLKP